MQFLNIADPKVQSLNGFYGKEREVRLEISILELPCFEGIVNTDRHQISLVFWTVLVRSSSK